MAVKTTPVMPVVREVFWSRTLTVAEPVAGVAGCVLRAAGLAGGGAVTDTVAACPGVPEIFSVVVDAFGQ
ncbi:hypothetical protein [Streptomyces sp. TE33382]